MDPEYITSADWAAISDILHVLWIFLIFAIGFGFNFLMAHAIIPSLVTSGHLPERASKLRRMFYTGAFISLAVVAFMLARAQAEARAIQEFWSRWWI